MKRESGNPRMPQQRAGGENGRRKILSQTKRREDNKPTAAFSPVSLPTNISPQCAHAQRVKILLDNGEAAKLTVVSGWAISLEQ